MIESGKLQKAVDLTIAAGYQLDKSAFEFLSMLATTEDPAAVMVKAIRRIEDLKEKPFFIQKHFLEQLLKSAESAEEIAREPQAPWRSSSTGDQGSRGY